MISNPPISVETLKTLDEEPWQPVSPRYATQLRVHLLIYGLVLSAFPWVLVGGEEEVAGLAVSASVLLALLFAALILFWVPRRVRHTRYLLRRLDMHMQTGLLWRRTTSVGINRLQHLEVSQGPLERFLGLSRLVLYTAGGMKSDLVLPGLPTQRARQLKLRILQATEQADGEAPGDDIEE